MDDSYETFMQTEDPDSSFVYTYTLDEEYTTAHSYTWKYEILELLSLLPQ